MKSINHIVGVTRNSSFINGDLGSSWGKSLSIAMLFGVWMLNSAATGAAELCVNPGGTGGCYALPGLAIAAAANGDTIRIHAGTYMEPGSIVITKSDLKIIGDNPLNTAVKNSVAASVFLFPSGANASAEIANLTITGGGHGIEIQRQSVSRAADIHHNIIAFNGGSGIFATGYCCGGPLVNAFNNVVRSNNGLGIRAYYGTDLVYNNIVVANGDVGIYSGTASYNSSYNNGSTGALNYNFTAGNIGNISLDCLFTDVNTGDLRLQSGSPCQNTGNPGYLDVDGTRSDMGVYGGPASALFWPYGNGGPVVTNLVVNPLIVPEGGTLSIKATVEIR